MRQHGIDNNYPTMELSSWFQDLIVVNTVSIPVLLYSCKVGLTLATTYPFRPCGWIFSYASKKAILQPKLSASFTVNYIRLKHVGRGDPHSQTPYFFVVMVYGLGFMFVNAASDFIIGIKQQLTYD